MSDVLRLRAPLAGALTLHQWWLPLHSPAFLRMMLDDPFGADLSMLGRTMTRTDLTAICLGMRKSWEDHGWGPYAIFSELRRFIGVMGPHPVDGIELPVWSVHLRKEWRGKGVTGIGQALREHIGLEQMVSLTMPGNTQARAALDRHFTYEGIREFRGQPVAWYSWEKSGSTSGKPPS